jgi:hypothetical protein
MKLKKIGTSHILQSHNSKETSKSDFRNYKKERKEKDAVKIEEVKDRLPQQRKEETKRKTNFFD